jgi:hypothetical protein
MTPTKLHWSPLENVMIYLRNSSDGLISSRMRATVLLSTFMHRDFPVGPMGTILGPAEASSQRGACGHGTPCVAFAPHEKRIASRKATSSSPPPKEPADHHDQPSDPKHHDHGYAEHRERRHRERKKITTDAKSPMGNSEHNDSDQCQQN